MLTRPDITKPAFIILPDSRKAVLEDKCPTCRGDIKEVDFRDELSKKEYSISGMCQKCQDKVFRPDLAARV